MQKEEARRWRSWEDYMREWLRRPDFSTALRSLLEGEDQEFTAYIEALARAEREMPAPGTTIPFNEARLLDEGISQGQAA